MGTQTSNLLSRISNCATVGIVFHTDGNLSAVLWETLKVTGTGNKRRIPWIVMTSDATDTATRAFFEENSYFGLEKSQASFVS